MSDEYRAEIAQFNRERGEPEPPERIWLSPTRTAQGYFVTVATDDLGAVEYVRASSAGEALVHQADALVSEVHELLRGNASVNPQNK